MNKKYLKSIIGLIFFASLFIGFKSIYAFDWDPGGGGGSGNWVNWSTGYSTQSYYVNPSGGSIYIRYTHGTGLRNPTTERVEITAVEFEIWSCWDPAVTYRYEIQVFYNGQLEDSRTGILADPDTTWCTRYVAGFNAYADYGDSLYLRVYVWVSNYARPISQCTNVLVEYIP